MKPGSDLRGKRWGDFYYERAGKEGVGLGQEAPYAFARQASKLFSYISMKQTVPDGTSEVGGSGRRAAHIECLCRGWHGRRQMCMRVDSGMRCVTKCDALESAQTLCDPVDCSRQALLSVGLDTARILEWITISSSRGSF